MTDIIALYLVYGIFNSFYHSITFDKLNFCNIQGKMFL